MFSGVVVMVNSLPSRREMSTGVVPANEIWVLSTLLGRKPRSVSRGIPQMEEGSAAFIQ